MEHDHETLRPIIVGTWMPEKVGGLPGKSLVFAETQVRRLASSPPFFVHAALLFFLGYNNTFRGD